MRIGFLSCRRFGVVTAPVFNICIGRAEASLQDRPFQLLEGLSVRGAGAPPVLDSAPDGSKLTGVAPAVAAHQEVDPDQSPLGPSGVGQLLAGYEARNFFTARHVTMARYLWLPGIRAGDCGPDVEVLLR